MTLPFVLSDRAEATCRLLNQTLSLHRLQFTNARPAQNRSRLQAPTVDEAQVQRQAILMRMVSITESFCADQLLGLAEAEVAPAGNFVRGQVWERASTAAVSNWEGIRNGYGHWFKIKPDWSRLDPLIEARNAIAHGLGRLTRTQLKNRKRVTDSLIAANFVLVDDRIVLDEDTIQFVRDLCADFIAELDRLIQQHAT